MRKGRSFSAVLLGVFAASSWVFAAEVQRVFARHILFPEHEKVQAEEVLAKLRKGELAWDQALTEYSIDAYTKHAGGRLGPITPRSQIAPEIKSVIFQIPEKSYCEKPVKTKFGWHILYVEKKDTVKEKEHPPPPKEEKGPSPKGPTPGEETKEVKRPVLKASCELSRQDPTSAQVLDITVRVENSGKGPAYVPRPELWPVGITLTRDPEPKVAPELKKDYLKALGEEAGRLVVLLPKQAMEQKVRVGEVWDNVTGPGYWSVSFSGSGVLAVVEKEQEAPWSKALKEEEHFTEASTVFRTLRTTEEVGFDLHTIPFGKEFYTTAFYVVFRLRKGGEFLVKLTYERIYGTQVRHFIRVVRQGYYKDKYFYKRQAGDFIAGGSEDTFGRRWGKYSTFISASVLDKVSVKKKDFLLVARPQQFNYEGGGNFMIALRSLPSYKRAGLPIGKVVGGWDVVENLASDEGWRQVHAKRIAAARFYLEEELPSKWEATIIREKGPVEPKGPYPLAEVQTARGTFELELYEDDAPNTVANFIELVQKGFYNGLAFHRVEDWVVQTGDPTGTGKGGPGYRIKDEVNAWRHVAGAAGMAKLPGEKNSHGSQFYIVKQDCFYLDAMAEFTVFGRVTKGMDVVKKLKKGDTITSVKITRKRDHPYKAEKIQPGGAGTSPKGAAKSKAGEKKE